MTHLFTGTGVALLTPFNEANEVDVDRLRQHIQFLVEGGIQAVVANGTTAESSTLTQAEQELVLRTVIEEVSNQVTVIANVGTNNTAVSIANAKRAQELGADAVMLITPYYNKTSQRGLIKHFEAILAEIDLPALLYDVPARTGMTIELDTLVQLSQHPQIYGLKDATGDLDFFKAAKAKISDDFKFYSGNDDNVQTYYQMGGHGVISVIANILPSEFQAVYKNPDEDYSTLFRLVDELSIDVNPIPIKALAEYLGLANARVRLPLVELEAEHEKRLIAAYKHFEKLVKE